MTNPFDPATSGYPRDMVGYGRNPPDPRWPGGAVLALQIVVNYEEGGENNVLHGDAGSESFLTEHITASRLGERALTAELLYYMRSERTPVLAWNGGQKPNDHYEMRRPFTKGSPEPVLLVALRSDSQKIVSKFAAVEPLGSIDLPAGSQTRRVAFWRLSGFKGF